MIQALLIIAFPGIASVQGELPSAASYPKSTASLGQLRPQFVEWPTSGGYSPELFRCTTGGVRSQIFSDRFTATFVGTSADRHSSQTVEFQLEGTGTISHVDGAAAAHGCANLLLGDNPSKWSPGLRAFRTLRIEAIYPGVDLEWYFDADGHLEYDLALKSGSDATSIIIRVAGADALRIDEDGSLRVDTASGVIRQSAPVATQESLDGERKGIRCSFRIIDSQRYGFEVQGEDAAQPVRIDPGILYATLLGGTNFEEPWAIDVDASGAAYLAGRTLGDFPTTPGAFDTTFGGGLVGDAFVTKLDPSGGNLVYSTYVGGTSGEFARSVSVDGSGCTTIGLLGGSPELPTTSGCYQSQVGGSYIAKLDSTGSSVLLATFFGGPNTSLSGLVVDSQGHLCFGGVIYAAELPATPGAFSVNFGGGSSDGWAAKLDATGSSLVYATYLGGSGIDTPYCVAVDAQGAIYASGETTSVDFPKAGTPLQPVMKGLSDVFVTKVAPSGSALDYSTYLGGTQLGGANERSLGIAVDSSGCAHVIGWTTAPDFPVTPGAVDMGPAQPGTGTPTFVSKLSGDGSTLIYSTRFVSTTTNGAFWAQSIDIDSRGNAIFCGSTWPPYLVTPDKLSYVPGKYDAFVTVLSPLGLGITYSTLWGASKNDGFNIVKADSQGHAYLLGVTLSPDFPTTPGAYDSTLADASGDLTVVKMSLPSIPFGTLVYGSGLPGCYGPHTLRTEASVKVGSPKMTLECDNMPLNSLGLILVSDIQDANGSDPLFLGLPLHVGLSASLFGLDIVSTSSNIASVTVPLPNLSGLVGSTFYFQAIWLWPQSTCAPSQFWLSASNGLAVTVIP